MAPNLTLPNVMLVGELPLDLTRRHVKFNSKTSHLPVDHDSWETCSPPAPPIAMPLTNKEGSKSEENVKNLSSSQERVDAQNGKRLLDCHGDFQNHQRGSRKVGGRGDLQSLLWSSRKISDKESRLEKRKVAVARKWLTENLVDIQRTAIALFSLLTTYFSFCKENGEQPMSELAFLDMLQTEFPYQSKEELVQLKKLRRSEEKLTPKSSQRFLGDRDQSAEECKPMVLFDEEDRKPRVLYDVNDRKPILLSNEKERKPVVLSDEKERKPVVLSDVKERKPVVLSDVKERKPLVLSGVKDRKPMVFSDVKERKPMVLSEVKELKPMVLSDVKERKPMVLSDVKDRKPMVGSDEIELKPIDLKKKPIKSSQNDQEKMSTLLEEDSNDSGCEEMDCVDSQSYSRDSMDEQKIDKKRTSIFSFGFPKSSSMESDSGSYDSGFDSYEYDSDKHSSESDSESQHMLDEAAEDRVIKLNGNRHEEYGLENEELGSLVIDESPQVEEEENDEKPIVIKVKSLPREVHQCDSMVSDSGDSRNDSTGQIWNESQRKAISNVIALLELKEFSEAPCSLDARKFSQIFVQMLTKNLLSVFLETFGHSMSCRAKQCSKLCFMFKRIFKHMMTSANHRCAVKQIYGHILRLHIDTCKVDSCGITNCRILKSKRIAAVGGFKHPSLVAM